MSRQFTLSTRVTADVSAYKSAMAQGAAGARDLGTALGEVETRAQEATRALGKSGEAARGATAAGRPSAAGTPSPAPTPRPQPLPPAPPARPPAPGGLAEWQKRNLRSQYYDVATSLSGGMSPFTVLSQQGPQIVEIYGSAGAAIRGVASAVTLARVASAGLAGAVIAGAMAWRDYVQAQDEAARSLNGMGRASGLTVAGLRDVARQAAAQGRLSQSDALSGAQGFAAAGVRGDLIAGLTASAARYARGVGIEAPEAMQLFAQALQEPAKGAEALSARLGFLDGKTREMIRTLMAQGDQFGAQKTLADALAASVAKLAVETNWFDRAMKAAINTGKDWWATLGKVVDGVTSGPGLGEQLAAAERRLSEAKAQTNGNRWWQQRDHDAARVKAQGEYDALKARADAERRKAEAAQAEIERARLSRQASDALRTASPDAARRVDLSEQIALLGKAKADPDIAARLGGVGQLSDAIGRLTQAQTTYLDADARQRQSDALAIRSIEARTVAQRAAIAADRERLSLAGQEVSAAEATRRAEAAAEQVRAQARVDARDRLRGARDQAALVGLPDTRRRLAESAQRWREPIADAAGDAKAQGDMRAAAALERAGIAREAALAPMRQARFGLEDQIGALERLKQGFGATTQAATEFAARQQLLNEYQRAGTPITAGLRAEVDRYAAAQGRVAQASEDLQRAQDRVVSGMDGVRAEARGAFSGLLSNLREGKNVADGLLQSATRIVDKMIETRVTGPLVESLLGRDGKPGGGMFGDAVAGWLGGGKALQQATINAATVIVNGQATAAGLATATGQQAGAAAASGGAGLPSFARVAGSDLGKAPWAVMAPVKGPGAAGLDDDFKQRLSGLFGAFPGLSLTSGFRTTAQQAALYAAKPGWAAPPGRSNHEKGLAADIGLGGGWTWADVHARAAEFGVHFPLARRAVRPEAWHAEPIKGWRRPSEASEADVPLPTVRPDFAFNKLTDAVKRASDATSGLGNDVSTVSKALSTGSTSLGAAGAQMGQNAQSFTAAGDGVFSAILGGVAQVGNSFVGGLGTALQTILQAISQSGGGGLGSVFSSLLGGVGGGSTGTFIPFADGGVMTPQGPMRLPRFAAGGVARQTAIFGEAGPEAAVPLPDGRTIPVTLRVRGGSAPDRGDAMPLAALAGAIGRLNDRLSAANAPREQASAGPEVVIENRAGATIQRRDETRPGGGRLQRYIVDETVGGAVSAPGSRTLAAIKAAQSVGRR